MLNFPKLNLIEQKIIFELNGMMRHKVSKNSLTEWDRVMRF